MATQKQISEHLNMSPKRVSELRRDEILSSNDIDTCRIEYIVYLRKLGGFNKKNGTGDITEEKTRLTKAQADAAELKVSELEGELIPAKLVENTWTEMAAVIRVKLLGLASKISHLVLGAKTYQDIEQIINKQIYETLNELAESNGIPKEYAERAEQHNANTKTTTETND